MYFFMILIYLLTGFSFIALLLTGIQGYFEFYVISANHVTFGFFTAIIYLFTEVLVMFFFVGTGVSIKEYIQEKGVSTEFHKNSLAIKKKLYPPTLTNVFLVMTVFIIGGGVDTGSIPGWMHGILFLFALYHFTTTIRTQHNCFKENTALILEMTKSQPNSTTE
ncbi:MAG: hypothetical protein QGI16_05535 [Candidatus Marinimicrobia bacterium]|nr:hypothetical protein [Candidatus Neomarinimicrobiota bacterium]MDP7026371.1 hypothetical protein [Candidatus Neomarinimicrobiota bacterium]|tara:strand:+ start:3926 stop:4417 length:492 start_codon:yes stop_codon:yes gene_type:complete